MLNPSLERFDIRNFTERLISKQGKNRYQCPVCEEGVLTIDPKTGAYHCWGEGCPSELIREVISPLSEALARIGIEKKGFTRHNSQEWTEQQREEWKTRQALRKADARLEEKAKREKSLTADQRHELYSKILDSLSLDATTVADLENRGFGQDEIANCGFKSVQKWQKLPFAVDKRLPGIGKDGKSLVVGGDGYLCPLKDYDGKIVALQLRLHNPDNSGRYRWISSSAQTLSLNIGDSLENPLTVFKPETPTGIAIVEGTGPKPYLASRRLNNTIIGAAGGQFAGSPKLLEEYLSRASKDVGIKEIVIYPDAGDIANKSVMSRWKQIASLIISFGYEVKFGWWGQVSKDDGDVDELTDFSQIEFISVDEFLSKGFVDTSVKEAKEESISDWKSQVLAVQKELHTLTYEPDYICNPNKKYLPDNLIDVIPHKGIVLLNAPKGSGKSVTIKRIKDRLCGGYWEENILPSQLSLTGENKSVIERIYHEKTGIRFISITARIALGRGQAIEWDITWIEDGDLTKSDKFDYEGELVQTATFLETADGIGLCWDSLAKLFDRDWSNSIVVIDEIELGLSHVATSSTCKDRRSKILQTIETKLKECLDGNGLVIGADADLTNITCDYLTAICPGYKPFIAKHDYIRPDADKWEIDFYSGKRDEVISLIENWLSDKDCEPIAVATDNQTEAEGLANYLIKKYPWLANSYNGSIRIDSTVTKTDFGKDFVKRPNEKIQEYQPKLLIYTPSMGTGCDLKVPYFKYVFGLFFGNLEPSQARQMLARVREPVPRIVWTADRGQTSASDDFNSFLPSAIKKQVFSHNDLTTQVIDLALNMAKQQTESNDDADILPKLIEQLTKMMGSNGTWDNPHIDLFCKLKARRNFALHQLSVQLRQELIDEGHILRDIAAEEKTNAGDKVREEKVEIKINRATRTAKAGDIELEQAKEINRKPNPTDEEQYQASKAFLKDELPGIELSPEFIFKAVHKDNRRWLNSVKFYWMINNVDATKEADRRHWKYKLKQFYDGVPYLPDIKTFSAKVEAVNKIRIFEVVPIDDFETEYFNSSNALQEWFKEFVLPNKKLLKTAFNITANKDTEIIPFINRILSKMGIKLKCERKSDNLKYYKLDAELVLDEDRRNVLEALDLKRKLQLEIELQFAINNPVTVPVPISVPVTVPVPIPISVPVTVTVPVPVAQFPIEEDSLIPMIIEQLQKISTQEEWFELDNSITPEQMRAAWDRLTPDVRDRIRNLFKPAFAESK